MAAWYTTQDWNNYREIYSGITYPVNGDDIPVPFHTPITAIFGGVISNEYVDASGATAIIKADNPSDLKGVPYYYYAHLDTFNVSTGQHVNPGDVIGLSGGQLSGGQHPASKQFSTGPHIMIGESKTGTIPYTLQDLTPDLNPEWMLQYAKQQNIPTNTNTFGSNILLNSSGQTPDALGNFLTSIQDLIKWISNPIRIIKLIFGIVLIGEALMLMGNPDLKIADQLAKVAAGKGGTK
jgi:murein DD-endopeptidase MepM/ murein hydrolase activator NlpD